MGLRAESFVALPLDLLFVAGFALLPVALPFVCPGLAAGWAFTRGVGLFCLLAAVRVRADALCLRS